MHDRKWVGQSFAWLHVGTALRKWSKHYDYVATVKKGIMSTLQQHSLSESVFQISTQSWFPRARPCRSGTCFCRHSWGSKRVRHVPHPSVEKQTKPKLAAGQRSVNMLCWTKPKHADSECIQKHDPCCFFAFLFDSRWSGRGACCYNVSKPRLKETM